MSDENNKIRAIMLYLEKNGYHRTVRVLERESKIYLNFINIDEKMIEKLEQGCVASLIQISSLIELEKSMQTLIKNHIVLSLLNYNESIIADKFCENQKIEINKYNELKKSMKNPNIADRLKTERKIILDYIHKINKPVKYALDFKPTNVEVETANKTVDRLKLNKQEPVETILNNQPIFSRIFCNHSRKNYTNGILCFNLNSFTLIYPGNLALMYLKKDQKFYEVKIEHEKNMTACSITSDGEVIAISDFQNLISLYHVISPENIRKVKEIDFKTNKLLSSLLFDAKKPILYISCTDNSLCSYNIANDEYKESITIEGEHITKFLQLGSNSDHLICLSNFSNILIFQKNRLVLKKKLSSSDIKKNLALDRDKILNIIDLNPINHVDSNLCIISAILDDRTLLALIMDKNGKIIKSASVSVDSDIKPGHYHTYKNFCDKKLNTYFFFERKIYIKRNQIEEIELIEGAKKVWVTEFGFVLALDNKLELINISD